jgi:hypothetical protein
VTLFLAWRNHLALLAVESPSRPVALVEEWPPTEGLETNDEEAGEAGEVKSMVAARRHQYLLERTSCFRVGRRTSNM